MPDVKCMEDLDLFGRECDSELEALDQDLVHRTLEKAGSNVDDPDRGLGLRDRLSGPVEPGFRQIAEQEYRKDRRVDAARAYVDQEGTENFVLRYEIEASGETIGKAIDANGVRKDPT